MKMLDEDLGKKRGDEVQTDDEENQAERTCEIEDDTESDYTPPSSPSGDLSTAIDITKTSWPMSYRQSVDMYTTVTSPSVGFLKTSSLSKLTGSMSSLYKRNQSAHLDSSPRKPLLSDLGTEEISTSRIQEKLSQPRFSASELPPPKQQCSFAQAVLNGINILCGVGLFATPFAVKQGGWLSLSVSLIFAVIACNTGVMLQKCLESSPGLKTYPDIGQAAFGKTGRLLIAITLYMELYAGCVEYIIMMADNLSSLFPHTNLTFAGMNLDTHQLFAVIATVVILPTVWLRDLTLLSYISVGGVATTGVVLLCLVWVGLVDQVGFHPSGRALDFSNLSVTVGIYGFCYAGHSVFPNIYSSMKEPSRFPWVLVLSFLFATFLYTGVAVCGYLMFGDSVKSQYTLNMPKKFVASKVALWTTVVIPMSKYALTLTPVALSLEELMPSPQIENYCSSFIIRTVLVISTLVVALTIPFFGSVMAFVGSLIAMMITLIFPSLCYLSICRGRLSKLKIATCICFIIVGILCAVFGTHSAVTRIADEI